MKKRLGFVTNSSSSSFICEICNRAEGGWDLSLEDCDMMMCENGHYMCTDHLEAYKHDLKDLVDARIKEESIIKLYYCLNGHHGEKHQETVKNYLAAVGQTVEEFVESRTVQQLEDIFIEIFDWEPEYYCNEDVHYGGTTVYFISSRYTPTEDFIKELCPICQHTVVTDHELLTHAKKLLNLSHSELVELTRQYLIEQDK